jgi:parallel beta-helix repeat protein
MIRAKRRLSYPLLAGATSALALLLAAPDAGATSGIMYVGIKTLTEDHYGTIVLGSDESRLDCAGHYIYNSTQPAICGDQGTQRCGVLVDFIDHGYVINCGIAGFDIGVDVRFSERTTIRSNLIIANNVGMRFYQYFGSQFSFIMDNWVIYNGQEGLDINSTYNTQFLNNLVYGNGRDGADIGESQGNLFQGNSFSGNAFNGIEFDASRSNSVINNTVVENGVNQDRNGISLDSTTNFLIRGNTVNSNGRDGIRITDGSNNGRIESNTASSNGEHDAHQASSTGNVWTGNTFGTKTGF